MLIMLSHDGLFYKLCKIGKFNSHFYVKCSNSEIIMIFLLLYNSLWGPINVVLFNTVIFLLTMAHLKAVFCDPGIVPLPHTRLDFSDLHAARNQRYHDEEEWTVCVRCETYRPPRAHHCRICKRCIRYVIEGEKLICSIKLNY